MGSGRRISGPASVSSHSLCPLRARHAQCSAETRAARPQTSPPFLNNLRLLPVLVMARYTQAPGPRGKRACMLVPSAWDQSVLCLSAPPGTGRVATRRCFVPFPHARCFSLSGREVCVGGREVQRLRPARRRAGGGEGHAGRVLSARRPRPPRRRAGSSARLLLCRVCASSPVPVGGHHVASQTSRSCVR